jgi:hypothetical protein
VIIGAQVSSRAPDHFIRPVLVLVLALTGLKLLDVPNGVLLAILVIAIVGGAVAWIVTRRRAHARRAATAASASPD